MSSADPAKKSDVRRFSSDQIEASAQDLLGNKSIASYFRVREILHSYAYCKSILVRRKLADTFLHEFESFLELSFTEAEISFIEGVLKDSLEKYSPKESSDRHLNLRLRKINPQGYGLLEITEHVNLCKLKSLYKQAARKHHPDFGGTVREMQLVNEAFAQFHEELLRFFSESRPDVMNAEAFLVPESWADIVASVHLVLACIYGDLLAADRAFEHFCNCDEFARNCKGKYLGQFVGELMGTGGVLLKVCHALRCATMQEELNKAANITDSLIRAHIAAWVPLDQFDERPSRKNYPSRAELVGKIGDQITFQINHPEQASNALRLGAISEKRFESSMKRLAFQVEREKKIQSKIQAFFENHQLVSLLRNSSDIEAPLVPEAVVPPFWTRRRFDWLDKHQQWKYMEIVSGNGTSKDFSDYAHVRITEILIALIENYEKLNLSNLKLEIEYFSSELRKDFPDYLKLLEILNHFEGLCEKERAKKCTLLKELDDPEPPPESLMIVYSLDGCEAKKPKKKIEVTDKYIEFAQMPSKSIEEFRNGQAIVSEFEQVLNRDILALRKLDESPMAKKKDHVWLKMRNPPPKLIIETVEPYVKDLLDLGKKFHAKNTRLLQLGYSIDRLTTAYGKIKDWEKVIYWAELFFNLPPPYREGSADGELNRIRKRLDRAQNNLKKE